MLSNYDQCLSRVLKDEGGYTNEATDPGGPTNFGITILDYRHYVKADASAQDVKNMKLEEAKAIYKSKYWDAQRCSDLPSGVDYAVFDYGINSGIGRSQKVLQQLVGVPVDGVIGPQTIAAVSKQDPIKLINAICDERLKFLKGLSIWPTYGKGWSRRVAGVRSYATSIAGTKLPTSPVAGPVAGATTVIVGTVAATHASPEYWLSIMGIVIVAAIIIGVIVHKLSNTTVKAN